MGIPQGMWGTAVLLALVTGILLYLGWGIRRRRTKPAKYQGKEALFTAYLAQSAAWTGAVLFGWYVGILLPLVIEVFHGDFLSYALWDTLTIIAALSLWIAGIVVENWCRLDDDNDSATASASALPKS